MGNLVRVEAPGGMEESQQEDGGQIIQQGIEKEEEEALGHFWKKINGKIRKETTVRQLCGQKGKRMTKKRSALAAAKGENGRKRGENLCSSVPGSPFPVRNGPSPRTVQSAGF